MVNGWQANVGALSQLTFFLEPTACFNYSHQQSKYKADGLANALHVFESDRKSVV